METISNHRKKMKIATSTIDHEDGSKKEEEEQLQHAATHTTHHTASSGSSDEGSDSTTHTTSIYAWPEDGFHQTKHALCSFLTHPMGFPLFIYLNDVARHPDHPAYIWTALDGFTSICRDNHSMRDNVFAATVLDWRGSKKVLTKNLLFNINSCKIGESLLTTDGNKHTVGTFHEPPSTIDLVFHDFPNETVTRPSVVALFEFGLKHDTWTRQHHLLKCVGMLRKNAKEKYKIDQPMLLCVVTMNKDKVGGNTENDTTKKNQSPEETFHANLKSIVNNELDVSNVPLEARFGVFLCTPSGEHGFRLKLLWRQETTTLQNTSTQFGKLLYAVQLCSYLKDYCDKNEETTRYKRLGPNCCKIGNLVFRSYDSRFQPSDQRPDLYFEPNVVIGETAPIARSILKMDDEHVALDFGASHSFESVQSEMDWLWTFQGKVLVISTPYLDGVHYAMRSHHFLPIIDHLEHLHSHGFVHGDIRAYNMILQYDTSTTSPKSDQGGTSSKSCKGWLIDFDLGGKQGVVSYPKGYEGLLNDGRRPGREGNRITIMDDWKALIGLIFHTHVFLLLEGAQFTATDEQMRAMYNVKDKLEDYDAKKVDSNDPLLSDSEQPAKLLREYLYLTSNTSNAKPCFNFR